MKAIIDRLEFIYKEVLGAELSNWSCLLNNFYKETTPNPHLHLHVRPRYKNAIVINDHSFEDTEFAHHYALKKETWDSVKRLIPKKDRMREVYAMEAEYLNDHPNSGYLTQILPLKSFPDYIDYLPKGCIVRKIGVMGYLPEVDKSMNKFISMSQDEYAEFVKNTIQLVVNQFAEMNLM